MAKNRKEWRAFVLRCRAAIHEVYELHMYHHMPLRHARSAVFMHRDHERVVFEVVRDARPYRDDTPALRERLAVYKRLKELGVLRNEAIQRYKKRMLEIAVQGA